MNIQLIKDGTYFVAAVRNRIVGCGGWSKRKALYGGDQNRRGEDPLRDPAMDPAMIRAITRTARAIEEQKITPALARLEEIVRDLGK